jgi:hypothetical protein
MLWDKLGYWQLVVKKKLGQKVSSRLIEWMQVKGQVTWKAMREIDVEEVEL